MAARSTSAGYNLSSDDGGGLSEWSRRSDQYRSASRSRCKTTAARLSRVSCCRGSPAIDFRRSGPSLHHLGTISEAQKFLAHFVTIAIDNRFRLRWQKRASGDTHTDTPIPTPDGQTPRPTVSPRSRPTPHNIEFPMHTNECSVEFESGQFIAPSKLVLNVSQLNFSSDQFCN